VISLGATERRNAIMRTLCRRRHETIHNLAFEFGVSERTIRRDIDILSLTEPIYTQTGRYSGGVYVIDQYYLDKMYFEQEEELVMNKVSDFLQKTTNVLDNNELKIFKRILKEYTKPENFKIII